MSSYYYKPKKTPEEKLREDTDLRDRIEAIQLEFPGYGYRRIRAHLLREGLIVNAKKLRRIMREYSLYSVLAKEWVPSIHDKSYLDRNYPNLLKKNVITGTNQAWSTDITYIRLEKEFVFLSAIIDVYSRKIVGWALSRTLTAEFCLKSLKAAIKSRNPSPGCIHHSDRGTQYTSGEYIQFLKDSGFQVSMSEPACPDQNAYIESFFKTLKHEEVLLYKYRTLEEATKRLPYFLEEVYNRKRLHSSIGYLPPEEYEQKLQTMNRADWPVQKLA
jgi:transposase InsO family protein